MLLVDAVSCSTFAHVWTHCQIKTRHSCELRHITTKRHSATVTHILVTVLMTLWNERRTFFTRKTILSLFQFTWTNNCWPPPSKRVPAPLNLCFSNLRVMLFLPIDKKIKCLLINYYLEYRFNWKWMVYSLMSYLFEGAYVIRWSTFMLTVEDTE